MKKTEKIYNLFAVELVENFNLESINSLDEKSEIEYNKASDYVVKEYEDFLTKWKQYAPELRALYFQRFGDIVQNAILKYRDFPYPINKQNLEHLNLLMDSIITFHSGTDIEILSIQTAMPKFEVNKDSIKREIQKIIKSNKKLEQKKEAVSFSEMFEKVSHYNHLMHLMVNEKLIQAGSCFWIQKKGGKFGFLISIIKTIHSKKYLKTDVILTDKVIQIIAKSHFGTDISISTIEKHDITKTFAKDLNFIPLASQIPK